MIRKLILVCASVVAIAAVGCSSHRPTDTSGAGAGAGVFANAGTTGGVTGTLPDGGLITGMAGTGAAAGTGVAGTGSAAGTGAAGMGNQFMLTCDTSVTSATMCGSTMCPAVSMQGMQSCTVNCCMNNECGTMRAVTSPMQFASQCTLPPKADPRCPSEMINGQMRISCCTMNNECGLLSRRGGMMCTPRQMVNVGMGGMMLTAQACDANEADAGN